MKNIQISKKEIIIAIMATLIGIAIGMAFGKEKKSGEAHNHEHTEAQSIWTCSMHPQIKLEKEGDCPICGMDLIPLSENAQKTSPNAIAISAEAKALLNLQTYKVAYRLPVSELELNGKIETNAEKDYHLSANYSGRIEQLFVNYKGQEIYKGQKLALIYSPELIEAQQELFEAAKWKNENEALYSAVVSKLMLWGLTQQQIDNMEKSGKLNARFELLSPVSGTLESLNINTGNYINKGQMLMSIADLSSVWLSLDAYESDLAALELHQDVQFSIKAFPGKQFSGKISFIEPFVNENNRITQIRIETQNPRKSLKPGMIVSAVIVQKNKQELQLMIPKSAALFAGNRYVVYVKDEKAEGTAFLYREIIPGAENSRYIWVKEGLEEGEEVLINSVFKVDAAAQLAGLPSLMNPPTKQKSGIEEASQLMLSQLNKLNKSYLLLQTALAADDENEARKHIRQLISGFYTFNYLNLKTEEQLYYQKVQENLRKYGIEISEKSGIKEIRQHFYRLSEQMIKLNYRYANNSEALYLAYCPMANKSAGAYWLSAGRKIANPYFGKSMLRCGEVRDSLNVF